MIDEKRLRRLDTQADAWRIRVRDDDDRKTYDEVFDAIALRAIQKLISDRVLETVDYPVSTGKEGNVFHATAPGGRALALKIYRVSNATFRALSKYIVGDPRFRRAGRSRRRMITAWALKEFRNLQRMTEAGVRVPAPVAVHENLLLMGYVGNEELPAPVLRTVAVEDVEGLYEDVVANLRGIVKSGLVHGDFSEYNLLWWEGRVWVIDVGQAVPREHGLAAEWHRRDLENVARYFTRLGRRTSVVDLEAVVGA